MMIIAKNWIDIMMVKPSADFTGEEDPKVYTRIAQASYELKQFNEVLEPANKAIKLAKEPNKAPDVLNFADQAQGLKTLGDMYAGTEQYSAAKQAYYDWMPSTTLMIAFLAAPQNAFI